jgi:hypothetical protein
MGSFIRANISNITFKEADCGGRSINPQEMLIFKPWTAGMEAKIPVFQALGKIPGNEVKSTDPPFRNNM